MRALAPLALAVPLLVACSGAILGAGSVPPRRVSRAPGRLVVRLGGPFPGFRWPVRVRHPEGSLLVPDGERTALRVPGHPTDHVPFEIEGWRRVWLPVRPGGEVRVSAHDCCGLEYVPRDVEYTCARDAVGAVCDPTPLAREDRDESCGCPAHTAPVQPDAVTHECTPGRRCEPVPFVRVVSDATPAPVLAVDDGRRIRAEPMARARFRPLPLGMSQMLAAAVVSGDAVPDHPTDDIALEPGSRVTIHLDATAIRRVVHDGAAR
ncbi:MAG TPA: hypothetical protein RMH99_08350 [Sandaracinaceae bacterium LLY-WYZ-13_1]|nr:hypothetical protein [Sandaracinaceae bacterium LLY-WYZ-13_1]